MSKDKKRSALYCRMRYQQARDAVLDLLGSKCARCPVKDRRVLCVDHVNGGGRADTRAVGNRRFPLFLKRIKAGSKDYQLLCCNCNQIKRIENREGPTKKHDGVWTPRVLRPCGTHASYHRGCRCDECVRAHRDYCRVAVRKSKKRKLREWSKRGSPLS